jgi:hypothetical protein
MFLDLRYTTAMSGKFQPFYKILYSFLGISLVAVVFYTGFLEGKRTSDVQPVTLSCKDDVLDKLSISLEKLAVPTTASAATTASVSVTPGTTVQGQYVGSKNGTKYYLPTCGTAKRIKPQNDIWFASAEDAQIQGYTPGKC